MPTAIQTTFSYDSSCDDDGSEIFTTALIIALAFDFAPESPLTSSVFSEQVTKLRQDFRAWQANEDEEHAKEDDKRLQAAQGLLRQLRESCLTADGRPDHARVARLQDIFRRAELRLDDGLHAAAKLPDERQRQRAINDAQRAFANMVVFTSKFASSIFRWASDTAVPEDIRLAVEQHGFDLIVRVAHTKLEPQLEALITLMEEIVHAIPGMDSRSPELFRWTQVALDIATSPMCKHFEDDLHMRRLLASANAAANAEIVTNVYRDDPADDGISKALLATSIEAIHGAAAAREILAVLDGIADLGSDLDNDHELLALYGRLGRLQKAYSNGILQEAFSRQALDYFQSKIEAASVDVGRSMSFAFLLNRAPHLVLTWSKNPQKMRQLFGRESAEDVECANADRIFFELLWQMCLFDFLGQEAYEELLQHPGVAGRIEHLFLLLERSQQIGNALGTLRREIFVADLGNFVAYRIGNDSINELLNQYPSQKRRGILWNRIQARFTPDVIDACWPMFDEIFSPQAALPAMPLIALYSAAQKAFDSGDPSRGYRISQMIWAALESVDARAQAFASWKRNEDEIQETIAALHATGAKTHIARACGDGQSLVPITLEALLPAAAVAESNRLLMVMHCMLDREPRYFDGLEEIERW